jgi:cytochrome c
MKSLIPLLLLALVLVVVACPKAEAPPTAAPGVAARHAPPPAPPQQAKHPATAPAPTGGPGTAPKGGAALVAEGEKLFNDKTLGKSGSTCATCHPSVKDLTGVAATYPKKVGGNETTLEDKINQMIKENLKGAELKKDDPKMKALTAYVKAYKKVAKPTPKIPQAQ